MASALLLGPSLFSVQTGDGTLMGPFGQTVGMALNKVLGLGGYLFVLALIFVAVRIFAGGLGHRPRPLPSLTLWRKRAGVLLAFVCFAIVSHLIFRPSRIGGASVGGLLGEVLAEMLCAVLSTPGAWVVGLTMAATALVLTTSLSLARLGLVLVQAGRRSSGAVREGLGRSRQRLGELVQRVPQLLQRQQVTASSDGSAALPPVVRIDLGDFALPARPETEEAAEPKATPLPGDLEIGTPSKPPSLPDIPCLDQAETKAATTTTGEQADRSADDSTCSSTVARSVPRIAEPVPTPELPQAAESAATQVVTQPEPQPAAAESGAPAPGRKQPATAEEELALTIVEPTYQQQEAAEGADDASDPTRAAESPQSGPGFVLHNDSYQPPPLSLLDVQEKETAAIDRDAIYQQADRLVKTLSDYKILGRVTEVHPGPVVTMYEFKPAPGTRISKIANLASDLAMSLAAQRVRIVAPIPGKGTIGIEVPNERRDTVFFKEIVGHDTFRKAKSQLTMAMGKNIFGAPVTLDLAKMPHLLVAGATGAGKSVSINAMICSLLLKSTPEEVRMIMVDPKYLELSGYNDIPHLMLPVVTDPAKANTALRWAVREMERRYQLLAEMRVRDIRSFNRKVDKLRGELAREAEEEQSAEPETPETLKEACPSKVLVVRKNADGSEQPLCGGEPQQEEAQAQAQADSAEPETATQQPAAAARKTSRRRRRRRVRGPVPDRLPYIVVVIDEFADLMMVASKEVETSVARLAQKARAAGIHVILATQRPSVDVITGLIKANFPSRVSFQVASGHDSKTILGSQGAEHLLGAGDMLVLDRGAEMKRLHGAYISDDEIQRVIEWLKEQGKPVYDMDILAPKEDEEEDKGAAKAKDDDYDEMYDEAVALVAESRQASISMIQRRLRVGYNRAARMVERMERDGVVGPPDGVRGREVLIGEI